MFSYTELASLMVACKEKNLTDAINIIKQDPKSVNTMYSHNGYSPINYAIEGQINNDLLRLLIDNGAINSMISRDIIYNVLRNNTTTEEQLNC